VGCQNRRVVGADAPPSATVVLAHILAYRSVGAGGAEEHTVTVAAAVGLDVQATLREVDIADALLGRVGQVRHHRRRVHTSRQRLGHIDLGDLAEQPEYVGGVDHVFDIAVGIGDQGAGDDQRYPDPGLIGGALRATRVERRLHQG